MGHLELGPHRPAAGLIGALQVGDAQEYVLTIAGPDPHAPVAMRAYELVGTQTASPTAPAGPVKQGRLGADLFVLLVQVTGIAQLLLAAVEFAVENWDQSGCGIHVFPLRTEGFPNGKRADPETGCH
ncbi:hypothetical protein [Pseudomonas flexibilis]|uniref:hypothetical protein n=1 Tax=Pseudomonas flexibilis TaxID=706570 RepID=UPI001F3073DA|nr:hypothetical protein [Pseudomonas flexibilis]